ncbi:MAG: helix-turn-helix transcriptional regulator [Acidimicrobiia bacterium]|nr:helix-turn-helix transcriptional regulator [Acidimicrobiia bacterium]
MAVTFGEKLRSWRTSRHFSQLGLAAEAGVSQRHISFLETGRAKPSREMVIHLAAALNVPLRQRNELLDCAGFAPAYRERSPDDNAMRQIHDVLERLLAAHDPYPAYIVDRLWNLVAANEVATRVMAMALPPEADPAIFGGNVVRLMLHPDGARHAVVNWEAVAGEMLRRLARDVADQPGDEALAELLDEAQTYLAEFGPGLLAETAPSAEELLIPIVLSTPIGELETFTTIATIGAPHDDTLEELRIETLLPATDEAEQMLRKIAAG